MGLLFLAAYARRGWRRLRARGEAVAEPPVTFAGLLRKLRTEARLTQEELAEAARLSPRSVSDLERGIDRDRRARTRPGCWPTRWTWPARPGPSSRRSRGAGPVPVPAPGRGGAAATRTLPRDIASFTGREQELRELVDAAAACGRRGGHPRDRRDGRDRQDRVRGARRAPARAAVPGRADLPAAARAHARAAAGGPGRRAGQPAADRRGPGRADPARPGGADGAVAGPAGRTSSCCWCSTTRPSSEQVRPLLPGTGRQPGAGHQPPAPDRAGRRHGDQPGHAAARGGGRAAGPAGRPARPEPARPGGGRDHPAVRVPAAGGRDAGPPAAPPSRPGPRPGWPPTWPRRGTGWS